MQQSFSRAARNCQRALQSVAGGDLRALLRDGGLTGQLAKPAASRWLIDPAHSTAFDTLTCSPVIIACSAVPVRYSVAAILASRSPSAPRTSIVSFSERGSARPAHDGVLLVPEMPRVWLPASLSVCP